MKNLLLDIGHMKTIIFLNRESYKYACYEFDKIVEIRDFRKVAIIGEDYRESFPKQYNTQFDKIYTVKVNPDKVETCELDYLEFDSVCIAIEKEIVQAGGHKNIFVITADEINIELVGALREKYSLFGVENKILMLYRNKYLMKNISKENNVKIPFYAIFNKDKYYSDKKIYFDEISSTLGIPFIIKPIGGSGSFDTYKITSLKEFNTAFKGEAFKLKDSEFLLEEYIDGKMFSCDTLTAEGQFITSFVSEYSCPPLDVARKNQTCVSIPLLYDCENAMKIKQFCQLALQALGKVNGCSHMEVFEKKGGDLVFLEVGARPPGGRAPFCYQKMYDYDLFHEDLLAQIGMGKHCKSSVEYTGLSCAWGVIPKKIGRIEKINMPKIESTISIDWTVKEGDVITSSSNIVDVAAVFIITNSSYETLYSDFEYLRNFEFLTMALKLK